MEQQDEKPSIISIEVIRQPALAEGLPSGKLEDTYDDQTLGEWYDFADTIEGIVAKLGNVVSVSMSSQSDSLSDYIDFYMVDAEGNQKAGLIDLRLSDHPITANGRTTRKRRASKIDPDYTFINLTVHDKSTQFHSYWQAEQYLRKELANILMNG